MIPMRDISTTSEERFKMHFLNKEPNQQILLLDASICFPGSFLIYLTLPQQTREVQLDISPWNMQWAMKRGKSGLARIPFPIQSPKLQNVPFICLLFKFIRALWTSLNICEFPLLAGILMARWCSFSWTWTKWGRIGRSHYRPLFKYYLNTFFIIPKWMWS